MNQANEDINALEQAAFEAKRRADQIEKDKIIRQHEREEKRQEREIRRKRELSGKLVAPLILLVTILISLALYYLR